MQQFRLRRNNLENIYINALESKKKSLISHKTQEMAFEKHWYALGRQILTSERMASYNKNTLEPDSRKIEYLKSTYALFCTLQHSSPSKKNESEFEICKKAFGEMKLQLFQNMAYNGKFVAFVHGKLQDSDSDKSKLVLRMYEKFGDVDMFVDKVETNSSAGFIRSPRLI